MKKFLKIAVLFSSTTLVLLVLAGLVFRATFYWTLPVNPGDAYGVADVLELVIYFTILVMAGSNIILGLLLLMIPTWRDVRLAIISLIVSVLIPPLYFMLHSLVPRLM